MDEELERAMELAHRIVNLGRAARNASSLRVRQPLRRLAVAGLTERDRQRVGTVSDLIQDELNVREIVFPADRGELLQVQVKPNYPVLGKKAGAAMKELASKVQSASPDEVRAGIAGEGWEVEAGGQRFMLVAEDLSVQESSRAPWVAQADGALAVAVDTVLDEELRAEGLVREFAHRIQTLRKSAEFDVTDRIRLFLEELSPGLAAAATRHEQFIREEVLAEEVLSRAPGNGPSEEWTFDGERARVGIERVHKGG
jgi:isoleucyl-tRNA synthetase